MLARLLAQLFQLCKLLLDLLVETVGVEQAIVLLQSGRPYQHLAGSALDLLQVLLDQHRDVATHHLAVLHHRIENPDRLAESSRLDVIARLLALGQMGIAQPVTQVTELLGALDHLDELGRIDAQLLLVEQSTLGIEEQQSRLVITQVVCGEHRLLFILEGLDGLLVAGPPLELLDRITVAEEHPLEVGATAVLRHLRGVQEHHHRLHRAALAVHRVVKSLALHPWQEGALTWKVGRGTGVSATASTTGRSGTPGNPGDCRANTSALGKQCRTGEVEEDQQRRHQPQFIEIHHRFLALRRKGSAP